MAHELSLSPGQTVFVTRKHRTGWWEGVLADGTKGWFPSSILDPTPLAHQGPPTSDTPTPAGPAPGGLPTDLSKAPGYGAYASTPAPAAQHVMTDAPGYGAYAGQRGPGGKGGAGVDGRATGTWGGASDGGPGHDVHIPAALTKETVALLRELKAVASQLRGSRSRQRKASADTAAAAAAAAGGSLDADLSAEATIASLQAQLAAQAREAQAQQDLCARLERDKAAAEERCGHVEEQLRACAAERDRALAELDNIKQDPDLYFAGIATGDGRGGGSGGGSKRRSGVSMASSGDDVDFDEEDVDFESHAPRGG